MKRTCKRALSMLLVLIMLLGVLPMTALAANWNPDDKITITVDVYDQATNQIYRNVGTDTVTKGDENIQSDSYRIPALSKFTDAEYGRVTEVTGDWLLPYSSCNVGTNVVFSCNSNNARITYWVDYFTTGGSGTGGSSSENIDLGGNGKYTIKFSIVYHSNYPDGTDYTVTKNYTVKSRTKIYNVFSSSFLRYSDCGFGGYTPKSTEKTWYTTKACTQTCGNIGAENGKTYQLYAGWKNDSGEPATQVTVTYKDGSETLATVNALSGDTITAIDCTKTKEGYTFEGWDTNPAATTVVYEYGDKFVVTGDTTLYAVWEQKQHEHTDNDGDGLCDEDGTCMHDHDGDGYCTVDGCTHGDNCCPKRPQPPQKPSNNDVVIILGNAVEVKCTNTEVSHETKTYVLLPGGYTIGSVEGDEATGYYCDVTIKLATYVAKYNEDLPGHTAAEGETDKTIRLNYEGSGDGFRWIPSPASVTFNVVCKTPEEKPDKYPVKLVIYRNGDTSNAFKTFDLGSYKKGDKYNVGDLEISDYYSSAYGFEFEGWYNDGGWNQYKAGNKNSKLGDKITINGWTNLHAMVYDKYPVYANVYHNNDTSKPVASKLLGNYPHGTGMADILEDKGLTDSLDSLYPSAYGYDWEKIWSHEISNYPNPVGNRTVSGWTNLCTMVYDKVPVVYFRTLEDLNLYQNPETRDNDLILEMTTASVGSALPTPDAPTAVREGYTFLYWSKEGQAEDVTGQTVSGWTNLYAAWEANTYTVSFDANGGTVTPASKDVTFDAPYGALPTPVRTGYTFTGWYLNGEEVTADTVVKTAGNHTLTAQWEANSYTVSFDANGGTVEPASKPVTFDKPYGELPTPERTGYTFTGWYLGDAKVTAETIVKTPEDHTLVAQWTPNLYTVTYTDGVESRIIFEDQNYTVPYGDETPAFDGTPKRAGYVFTGWTPAVAATVIEDVVYKATWRRVVTPVVEEKDDPFYVRDLNYEDHVAYINGYPDGTVRPTGDITRAEAATIFFRLMTDSARNKYWRETSRFTDVADSAWYAVAVATLDKYGAIVDSENGEFRPDEPITRAELAVMAAQFCTLKYDSTKTSFTDVSRNYWAAKEIALIEQAGWIVGHNGKFRPNDTITRAETITIINRMLHRGVDDEGMLKGMIKFSDNVRSAWYYEAVQEAANSHTYTYSNRWIPGEGFHYENWQKLVKNPDWVAIERGWKDAHK